MSQVVSPAGGSLRKRSIEALLWSSADTGSRQALQFFVSIMLARLLSPAEFGLVGMLSLFLALAQLFADGGFGLALVQRGEITEADKSTVFFFNLAAGGLMAACLYIAAPWIASFYREGPLTGLTRFMALNLVVGAFGSVHAALLARELNFRTPWKIGMIANGISGGAAVWMASHGFGVWSLAAQTVLCTVLTTLLLWALSSWRPRWSFRIESLRRLFEFGSKLLAAGLLNTVFERLQLLLIGKRFSPVELGYYTRAYSTQQAPASIVSTIVTKVTFPVFSALAGDPPRLKRGAKQAIGTLMVLTSPMMVGLAATARPLVIALFGARWLPCVPYLQVLAIVGVFWPLNIVNLSLLSATGRSDLYFRAEVIKKVIIGAAVLFSFQISVMAMVWAMLAANGLCYLVSVHFACKVTPYGLREQARDYLPTVGAALGMAGVVLLVENWCGPNTWLALTLSVTTGAASYCAICWVTGVRAFKEGLRAIWNRASLSSENAAA
ncbi:MAG: lipopolysaccharide biosynthesis protein [Bryobacteraceae bacterium]